MTMTTDHLTRALHACAAGMLPLEAGVALLTSNRTFLHRDDFTSRIIQHGTSSGVPIAAIDWDAAISTLNSSGLPCSAVLNAASSNYQPVSPEAFQRRNSAQPGTGTEICSAKDRLD